MKRRRATHPMQPVVNVRGVHRFKENKIVSALLDGGPFDMNRLAELPFPREDREQFAQLIGYSVSGFEDLDYASDQVRARAARASRKLLAGRKKRGRR